MSEDIIRLLGHTTITLRKENEELRQRIIHLEQASQTQSKAISDLKEKTKTSKLKTILSKVLKIKREKRSGNRICNHQTFSFYLFRFYRFVSE